jgi:hypothetical protein
MIIQDARKRMRGRVVRLALAMVALVACVGVQPAYAQTEEPCTYGGAQALLLEAPVAATQSDRSDRPHLGELWEECQFRLYRDGQTITFREGDYILGAIAVWWTYDEMDEFGLSRGEAIEDLQLITDRIEIAKLDGRKRGPFEPVPVIVTSYRDAQLFGTHIVFNQRGFIAHLPAGEYLVRWTQSYPGSIAFPAFRDESTVRLLVTPV